MLKCESHPRVDVKVSEDLFFGVKEVDFFLLSCFIEFSSFFSCLIFVFDCLSVTMPFVFQIIVYLNLCHWSNMYNYQSKKQRKKATVCYVQYFVENFYFSCCFFPRGNLWRKDDSLWILEEENSTLQGPVLIKSCHKMLRSVGRKNQTRPLFHQRSCGLKCTENKMICKLCHIKRKCFEKWSFLIFVTDF